MPTSVPGPGLAIRSARNPRRCATRRDRSRIRIRRPRTALTKRHGPPDGTFELELGFDCDKEEHRPAREPLRPRLFRVLLPTTASAGQQPRLSSPTAATASTTRTTRSGCSTRSRIRRRVPEVPADPSRLRRRARLAHRKRRRTLGEFFWRRNRAGCAPAMCSTKRWAPRCDVVSGYSPVEGDLEYRQVRHGRRRGDPGPRLPPGTRAGNSGIAARP